MLLYALKASLACLALHCLCGVTPIVQFAATQEAPKAYQFPV
jgi:hypothetical protein